ncbi:MAG: hypothetical protein Q8J84_05020 [Flavobacteriaceae bacterium]|nr:hypothetical protein [Flavobacteriaceae bacterium]
MIKFLVGSRQTFYSFLSNLSYTFVIWFIAVLINHYYGAKSLGEYSLVQAIISPLALFFHLQLKVLATLEINIDLKISKYINLLLFSKFIFIIIILVIGILFNQPILFYSFAVFKVFESFHFLVQGYYQSKNDFFKSFITTFIKGFTLLLLLWILFVNKHSISLGFIIISAIWVLLLIYFDFPEISKGNNFDKSLFKDFSESTPLIISGASLSIISSFDSFTAAIPRYFINGYYNDIELGKFTMVLQFFIASTIFVVSVGHPFLVKLKIHIDNNDFQGFKKEIIKTIYIFLFLSILAILFFILFGQYIMRLFWGVENEYLSNYLTLSMIGIIPLFLSSIFVYSINSLKYFSIHLKYYPLIIGISILFSWILIPKFGILGGIVTIILTQFMRMIITFFVFNYCYKKFINKSIINEKF